MQDSRKVKLIVAFLCAALALVGCTTHPKTLQTPAPNPASASEQNLVPASARIDPLPSWTDGAIKRTITAFVAQVTDPGSDRFVPEAERIATFDHDGTLWVEKPIYVQVLFSMDRVQALAKQHPEWKTQQPFSAVLERDRTKIASFGEKDMLLLYTATSSNMSPEAYERTARDWLETAKHPTLGRPFTELVYQPMLDLMAYLRRSGFKIFIVTGGDVDFVRAFSRDRYDVPPDRVIGTSLKYGFRPTPTGGVVDRLAELGSLDDGPGKPENIELHIGQRPIVAVGNSDGDLQMLEYAGAGNKGALLLLVHHDDAVREYAYDRDSKVGHLDKALDAAALRGWGVISMKRDFRVIFPPEAYREKR